MSHNQRIGMYGENLVKNYLIRHGYEIVGRNVKLSRQEIDIVARKDHLTVFIEVKTRISQFYGSAEEAFFPTKAEQFRKGIEMFIKKNKLSADNIRADLITVDINRIAKTAKIKHFKDVI